MCHTSFELLLSHLPGLSCFHKFTLEEGNHTDEALDIFLNRRWHRNILHLPHLSQLCYDTDVSLLPQNEHYRNKDRKR
jgi:hypothetical protein